MKKLKLQLEDLVIDSFATTAPKKAGGTVFGEQCTCPTACTCPGCPTCDASCNGTCGATCAGTCGCGTYDCGTYDCGTFDCGTDLSCVFTCAGFATVGGPGQQCIECAG